VGVEVNVRVEEDGSGGVEVVVALDADAVERVGGDLEAVMAVDDLLEAGWSVDGPVAEADGWTRVRISHPFGTPEEAAVVFDQIAAEDGPFQDFAVARETSFAETRWTFTGRVDLTGGLEAFGDEGLTAELDGEPLGIPVEELEAQLGESLSRLLQIRVSVRLPGEVTSNATTQAANGAVWQVRFGEDPLVLEAEGTERRTSTLVAAGIGALCAVALVVLLLVRLARRVLARDDRAAEPEPLAASTPDRGARPPDPTAPEPGADEPRPGGAVGDAAPPRQLEAEEPPTGVAEGEVADADRPPHGTDGA